MTNTIERKIIMTEENWKHCKAISDELDNIVNGYYKNIDGEAVEVLEDENGNSYIENNGVYYCEYDNPRYEDEGSEDLNGLDDYTLYDYFSDVLDFNWILDSDRSYRSIRIMVSCGGPNIYIDTHSGKVELYWWNEYAEYELSREVIAAIDDYFEEYWNCM